MATLCFGNSVNGNSGHDADDVLVLAFKGTKEETVPGADRANWAAKSVQDFISFKAFDELGDSLIAKIGGGSGGGTNVTESTTESTTENAGSTIKSPPTTLVKSVRPATETSGSKASGSGPLSLDDSSSSDTSASNSKSCAWAGHCTGSTCSSSDDCSGNLVCKSNKCS
jgi:hypothetical protein